LKNNISWSEKLYNYINKLEITPTCLNCGNEVNYISLKDGYRKYCSEKCSNIHTYSKVQNTMLKRYGVKNPFQSEIIKEKIKKSNLKKYGVEYLHQNKEIAKKAQDTMIERYGELWLKHIPSYNANSIIYLDILSEKIKLPIRHALNGGEKKFVRYWVDGYIEEYNICIEWDENKHNLNKQKQKDLNREAYLKENFNCQIFRINEREFLKNIEASIINIASLINNYIGMIGVRIG
jgi:hypothetical protein